MKITFVIPIASLAGGVRVVATHARRLVDLGHEVTVVSRPLPRPSAVARLRRLLKGRDRLPARSATPLLDFLGRRHVVLDRRRPVTAADVPDADAIVATWWETAEWVAAMPDARGRKFYLLQDYETFDPTLQDRVTATYRLPLGKIAVSRYVRDRVQAHCPGHAIGLAPNGVDLHQFDAPPRTRNDRLTVGFLYSASPRKRIGLAIDSLVRARGRIPDLRAVAFGQKPPVGMPPWIAYELLPPQDRIPAIYAACDLWLFPSAHEGFGLPLLEAMACRTPVLATRAGAAEDLIDGSNGALVAPDPAAFAEAMARVAAMPEDGWRGLSAQARRTAEAHGWQAATARLLDLLGDMSDRGSEHSPRIFG